MSEETVTAPVTRNDLDWLTQQACFAADVLAVDLRQRPDLTDAQKTKLVVGRAIEFLIGNGLVEVTLSPDGEGRWMQVEPPYDETKVEPRKSDGN